MSKNALALLSFIIFLILIIPVTAQNVEEGVIIEVDKKEITLLAGGNSGSFEVVITNKNKGETAPIIAHATLVRTEKGIFADPEDVFPTITYFIEPIQAGKSIVQKWEIKPVFDGKFIVYVTLISESAGFTPIISQPIHLNVTSNTILPMQEIITPIILIPLIIGILWIGRFIYVKIHDREKRL